MCVCVYASFKNAWIVCKKTVPWLCGWFLPPNYMFDSSLIKQFVKKFVSELFSLSEWSVKGSPISRLELFNF